MLFKIIIFILIKRQIVSYKVVLSNFLEKWCKIRKHIKFNLSSLILKKNDQFFLIKVD